MVLKKIGVVGCGSAGPAAAVLLAHQGHQVTLFERVAALGPVGAGFLLQPTGLAVLAALGILEPILDHGAPVQRLVCRTRGGTTLLDLHYDELRPGLYGVGLHRAVLLHYLAIRQSLPHEQAAAVSDAAEHLPLAGLIGGPLIMLTFVGMTVLGALLGLFMVLVGVAAWRMTDQEWVSGVPGAGR